MRLLFIRHGDPDYERDGLTETGRKEAQLLVPRILKENVTDFYVSPLGRAQETAQPSLEATGKSADCRDWLQEFPAVMDITGSEFLQQAYPGTPKKEDGSFYERIVWDMLPGYWRNEKDYYDKDLWRNTPPARISNMVEQYEKVTSGLDGLLADYGYVRDGGLYRTKQGSPATVAFFCHFGVTCVMLSHLWGVSPHILFHGLAMAPSSVTEVYTEERKKGEVIFRATKVGDISHLYAAGVGPSFSARFCELYEYTDQRH